MNDNVSAENPVGNEALLRQLFQDPLLHDSQLHGGQGAAQSVVSDERFVQKVMQDVKAWQRRELLFSVLPAVLSFVGVVLLASWMLTPFFYELSALFYELPAFFYELPAFFSQLPSLLAAAWSGTWSSQASGSGNLIPLLALLLALLLPTLIDRLPRMLKL